jgi:hypothetical protein
MNLQGEERTLEQAHISPWPTGTVKCLPGEMGGERDIKKLRHVQIRF